MSRGLVRLGSSSHSTVLPKRSLSAVELLPLGPRFSCISFLLCMETLFQLPNIPDRSVCHQSLHTNHCEDQQRSRSKKTRKIWLFNFESHQEGGTLEELMYTKRDQEKLLSSVPTGLKFQSRFSF